MRLEKGIVVDNENTFGVLKFSAMRRESKVEDEEGNVTEEIKSRTYDLKCKTQGCMIQVTLPAEVEKKEFEYNTEVVLVNPKAVAIANATFSGADIDWFIKADDIVLKGKSVQATKPSDPKDKP